MRKALKIAHTIAACGLIGSLACYMILLIEAPQDTPRAYADLRQSIAAVSNYLLLPSLAIGTISGLIAMAVHRPFLNQGWVWAKAATGILMFKGVLTIVGAKADYTATVSEKIANGEAGTEALEAALAHEWSMLGVVLMLSIANVVLGIWRPRRSRQLQSRASEQTHSGTVTIAASDDDERTRPAAYGPSGSSSSAKASPDRVDRKPKPEQNFYDIENFISNLIVV